MANITRIKAKDSPREVTKNKKPAPTAKPPKKLTRSLKMAKKDQKALKKQQKTTKKAEKRAKRVAKHPKFYKFLHIISAPFRRLAVPFKKLGRYLADSWHELRQVRWTNRKTTWKMVLAVFIYTAIFVAFIILVDALLTLLFNNLLK